MTNTTQPDQKMAEAVGQWMMAHDTAAKALGITLKETGPGSGTVELTITDAMLNAHGTGQGGVTFTLADMAFALACNSRNNKSVGAHCTITYVLPVQPGDELIATATEKSFSGRRGVYEVIVTNQNQETVALFQGNSVALNQPNID